ncbi:MAG TPA: hypothetical protein ENJ09_05385 [Planctomycetes bacterium]|nr:hypothetical protein [Planctomycetota bacterium]
MHFAPRTVAFLCELLHPPQVPDPSAIQRVHNRLFEGGSPLYGSFAVTPEGAVLSNATPQPGAVSSVAFLQDRFQFREELTGTTIEDFQARLETLVPMVLVERPIPIFTAQVVTIRTLVNPGGYRDSRQFLRDRVFGFGEELERFGRESSLYGTRFVFAPTAEEPHAFTLRIESFANDPRSLFLENIGSFGPTVPAQGLDSLGLGIRATYDFVLERALPFLDAFDDRESREA